MPNHDPNDVNDPEYDDPILAEIRAIRDELSDRFNGDMEAIGRYYMERQRSYAERMRTHPPQDARTSGPDSEPEAA